MTDFFLRPVAPSKLRSYSKVYDRRRKCAIGVLHLLSMMIKSRISPSVTLPRMCEQRWPLSMILVSAMGMIYCVTRRRAFSGAFKRWKTLYTTQGSPVKTTQPTRQGWLGKMLMKEPHLLIYA
jgi:hypothetical protein